MGGEGARVGSDARPSDHERDADVGLERPHLFHRQPHLRTKSGTPGYSRVLEGNPWYSRVLEGTAWAAQAPPLVPYLCMRVRSCVLSVCVCVCACAGLCVCVRSCVCVRVRACVPGRFCIRGRTRTRCTCCRARRARRARARRPPPGRPPGNATARSL
jgi:hypothetical protein